MTDTQTDTQTDPQTQGEKQYVSRPLQGGDIIRCEFEVKGTGSWCVLARYVRTISMQGFIILSIIGTEKHT